LKKEISPDEAVLFVKSGAQVVFDACGCGGICGFVYAPVGELQTLAKSKPILKSSINEYFAISLIRSITLYGTMWVIFQTIIGIILIILGIIYNNGLTLKPLEEIRFSSVLGRIGITYVFANIIYLYVKPRWFLSWFAGLLLSYYFLLKFFSAPNFEAGDLTMEGNFASYIDRLLLPGKLSLKIHDTVGFFNNIPAISNSLAGIMVGIFIKRNEFSGIKKTLYLAGLGLLSLLLAQLWNVDFPINKNLWSSSFVLQTVGLSLLLFSLFYYIIDVLGYQKWAIFFRVIGVNAILIYMSVKFIDWNFTARKFFEWTYQWVGDSWSMLMIPISILTIKWVFMRILYHYKIFLRI
jgi:predicted acyltransferase